MYLHRLQLDAQHPQARRDLGDAYELHATLVRGVAVDGEAPRGRLLWRTEAADANRATILAQTLCPADWSSLQQVFPGYLVLAQSKPVDVSAIAGVAGQERRFRLAANATVTRQGKRHALVREEDQLAWLARQGERHGFTVLSCMARSAPRSRIGRRRRGGTITLGGAIFDGVLRVEKPELLAVAIQNGLGHGKGFGFGLLSLGPS